MFDVKFLLNLLNKEKLPAYLFMVLLISIITIGDFFVLNQVGEMISIYLAMAILGSISLLSLIFLIRKLFNVIDNVQELHDRGVYPETAFNSFTGLIICTFLMVFPGFVSDALGIIIFLPFIRNAVGKLFNNKLKLDWHGAYEYMEIFSKD